MSFNFGSSDTRSKGRQETIIQQPSKGEVELQKLNLEYTKEALAQLKAEQAKQTAFEGTPEFAQQRALSSEANQYLLNRMRGDAPVLTPGQQQQLDTVYGAARGESQSNLDQYVKQIAAMRGMSPSDSPIGGEALKQKRMLEQGLAGSKAGASLDLANAQNIFAQNTAQFAESLRQQAFMNRMALAGQNPGLALQSSMFNQRAAGATRTMSGNQNIFNWGAGASAKDAGSFMMGLGGLGVGG